MASFILIDLLKIKKGDTPAPELMANLFLRQLWTHSRPGTQFGWIGNQCLIISFLLSFKQHLKHLCVIASGNTVGEIGEWENPAPSSGAHSLGRRQAGKQPGGRRGSLRQVGHEKGTESCLLGKNSFHYMLVPYWVPPGVWKLLTLHSGGLMRYAQEI